MDKSHSLMLPVLLTNKHLLLEDDCACPASAGSSLMQSTQTLLYRQAENVHVDSLPQGFQLAFSSYAPQGPSVLNASAWERWQSFSNPQLLTQPMDDLLAEQNLILPVGCSPRILPPHHETITVWFHITNACNLDCPYCYVQKSSASMGKSTGLKAIEKIFQTAQRHQFKRVKIKYAGGEATLHFGLIKTIGAKAQALAEETGINLKQVILSNGTRIHPDDAAWLIENNIQLMISLDGVGEIQDQMRPYRNGKGSFQTVSKTIDKVLLPNGILPMLTITITQHNAAGAADAVRWALERNLSVSLNFYRHKPGSPLDLAAEENALIEGMLAAYKVYEEVLPSRPFLNGLLDRVQVGGHLRACGVGSSYLAITHEGALAQCQMLLDRPVSKTLNGDLLEKVHNGPVHNLTVEQKDMCRECVYRYCCAGGCPLETYRASGRWNAPNPNCHIYKTLFPIALRLEGLRLLKYNDYVI